MTRALALRLAKTVAMLAACSLLACGLLACGPSKGPEVGSQTNWLLACDSSDDCGGLECLCGACTSVCEGDAACADLSGGSCVAPSDVGSIALCGGRVAESSLCLVRCEQSCGEGTSCVAGVCAPNAIATVHVDVDTSARHQTLVGFGASLAYADDAIAAHPAKEALYDLAFEEAGFDALRFRNRYEGADGPSLDPTRDILNAAAARLGRTPFLFMTSGTPPAALKANGSTTCAGDPQTCTLRSLPTGGFDYAGLAAHWRDALEAYASADITPDYVSIQNNANWVPPVDGRSDACRFLPEEGIETLSIDGAPVDVAYAGYREALAAVRTAIADLPTTPRFAAPEVSSISSIAEYAAALGDSVDALAVHLYSQVATDVDVASLEAARALAADLDRPVFQTEMQADGFQTAVLAHYALTAADVSVYLQNDLVSLAAEVADVALVLLTEDGVEPQGPYYALMHYAKHTDPGWVRVDARSDGAELLASAWLSPDERALTIVLVSSGDEAVDVELALPEELRARTEVTRSVFDGVERYAELGALSPEAIVRVPARSIVTISLASE
jgi:O-glycosyl hydrolase